MSRIFAYFVTCWMFLSAMHNLGYLIYRYQVELNYATGKESREIQAKAARRQQGDFFDVDIYLHEGRLEDAQSRLLELSKDQNNTLAFEKLIRLFILTEQFAHAEKYCEEYYRLLKQKSLPAQAARFFQSLRDLDYSVLPKDLDFRLEMASALISVNGWRTALQLCGDIWLKAGCSLFEQKAGLIQARIALEFEKNDTKALKTLQQIQKFSFDEAILAEAESLEQLAGRLAHQ